VNAFSKPLPRVLSASFVILWAALAGMPGLAQALADEPSLPMYADFATVDSATGLFRNAEGLFAAPSVTYVQPTPGKPGCNSGPIQVLLLELTKLRPDFRHMRENGIRCIYMRIGAGFFLNPDGSWRKTSDPLVGVGQWETTKEAVLAVSTRAAAQGIGPFTYNYEIFDYLLDTAAAEGIYVVPMIMDGWSLPRKYDMVANGTAILYEDVWRRVIADWSVILGRLKDRKVILGYLIEGETHHLPCWNEKKWFFFEPGGAKVKVAKSPLEEKDPRLTRQFRSFLKKRHGTLEALKRRWRHGYDRREPTWKNDVPFYPFVPGVFDSLKSFDEIELPTVERPRGPAQLGAGKNFPWWLNVPFDPVWTEFGYFKETLYTDRLNELFAGLRHADPNHMFMVSAASDAQPVWHPFFVAWDRGAINCEVLLHGGGYTNPFTRTPPDFPPHGTVMELYQSVAPYRPFAAAGTGSVRACGMGEGGLGLESSDPKAKTTIIPEQMQDRWINAIFMDNFGNGSALANLWDWGTQTGATAGNLALHDHQSLASIAKIGAALEHDTFTRARNARVLILANGPTLHSIMKSISYNNIAALSSALAVCHVPFDIVTTDEISLGPTRGKVDLDRYDAVFMPQQFQIAQHQLSSAGLLPTGPNTNPWVMLDEWLAAKPNRLLCVGLMSLNDEYFNPLRELPAAVRNVIGDVTPGPVEMVDGPQTWQLADGRTLEVTLNYTPTQSITVRKGATLDPFITSEDRVLGVRRRTENGSQVYYMGYPLGLSWMYFLIDDLRGGMLNEKFNIEKLGAFYGRLIAETDIAPEYEAPPSILAGISDNARAVFLRQRFTDGPRTGRLLGSRRLGGHIYAGATTTHERKDGALVGSIECDLGENYAEVLLSVGRIELADDGTVSVRVDPAAGSQPERLYTVRVEGNVPAKLQLTGQQAPRAYTPPGLLEFEATLSP